MRTMAYLLFASFLLGWASSELEDKKKPAPSSSLEGTLVSRSGDRVTVSLKDRSGPLPPGGSEGTLSKHFVKDLGFLKTSGWLEIARVTILTASAGELALRILELKSQMKVNGKPVDHFKKGARVKVTWK